jgi:hypothetical protein
MNVEDLSDNPITSYLETRMYRLHPDIELYYFFSLRQNRVKLRNSYLSSLLSNIDLTYYTLSPKTMWTFYPRIYGVGSPLNAFSLSFD